MNVIPLSYLIGIVQDLLGLSAITDIGKLAILTLFLWLQVSQMVVFFIYLIIQNTIARKEPVFAGTLDYGRRRKV